MRAGTFLRGCARLRRRTHLLALGCSLAFGGCSSFVSPPVDEAQVQGFAAELALNLAEAAPRISGPVSIDDAVSRAVNLNQRIRSAQFEAEIADWQIRIQRGELLPDVIADSGYVRRNKLPYSRSSQSAIYSTSSQLSTVTHNLDMSLNILDMGLTLVRMRQAGDEANIKHEAVRRVSIDIARETRAVYWRAVALRVLVPRWKVIAPKVSEVLSLSQLAVLDAALDPLNFINFQKDLLNSRRELNDLLAQIAGAELQLKELISVAPDSDLQFTSKRRVDSLDLPQGPPADDVPLALMNRPEVRQKLYDLRITEQEVSAAVLSVLPGAVLTQSLRQDSTSYLLHADWSSFAARATLNLMNLVRLPERLELIERQKDFNRQRAVELAAAVGTQVHVARWRLAAQLSLYKDAEEFHRSQKALLQQVRNSIRAGRLPEQMAAREELATLLAEVRAILAFGDVNAAYGDYLAAIGVIPLQ
ncbi:MAG: hypothetical protein C0519_06645 [Hyphomicrobium sp.]|nr:hypothetical protein [Hyphomicrobium sp.]